MGPSAPPAWRPSAPPPKDYPRPSSGSFRARQEQPKQPYVDPRLPSSVKTSRGVPFKTAETAPPGAEPTTHSTPRPNMQQFMRNLSVETSRATPPVRHLINKMKDTKEDVEKQLKRLSDVDLNNIFLFSTIQNAERYLSIANSMEIPLNTKKTKWFVLTKVSSFRCFII